MYWAIEASCQKDVFNLYVSITGEWNRLQLTIKNDQNIEYVTWADQKFESKQFIKKIKELCHKLDLVLSNKGSIEMECFMTYPKLLNLPNITEEEILSHMKSNDNDTVHYENIISQARACENEIVQFLGRGNLTLHVTA